MTIPVQASGDWTYYTVNGNAAALNGTSFAVTVWSNVAVQIDDMALYPQHADFTAYTYTLPFGKSSETDARGNTNYYEYDPGGQLKVVYDRSRNVVKKYDYLKP